MGIKSNLGGWNGNMLFDAYNGEDSFFTEREGDVWRDMSDEAVSFWVNKWGDSV